MSCRAAVGGGRRPVLAVLLLGLFVVGFPAGATDSRGEDVLVRAAQSARSGSYRGEALWISFVEEQAHVSRLLIDRSERDGLVVGSPSGHTLTVGDAGSAVTDRVSGWYVGLPDVSSPNDGKLARLQDKYEVVLSGSERLLDRPATVCEIRLREDGDLRERLWFDDASGLLVRREVFEEGELVRMAMYLSLDVEPVGGRPGPRTARSAQQRMSERVQAVAPVDADEAAVLRRAGWDVPETLPGDYRRTGLYAVSAEGQPLQAVYSDGLYTVSVFQQPGAPDWDFLPEGAEPSGLVDWSAYEWPGAIPQRLVWHADGRTWFLVGDAPPTDLADIAASLPRPQPAAGGVLERFRRGLRRIWSAVSPWSAGPQEAS